MKASTTAARRSPTSSASSTASPSRPTSWRSTPPWRLPAPASRAGLAVVAGEVRNLGNAAPRPPKRSRALIGTSVDAWSRWHGPGGQQAGATMTEVVGAIRRVTDIMGDQRRQQRTEPGRLAVGEAITADGPGPRSKMPPWWNKAPQPPTASKPRPASWWMPWRCSAFQDNATRHSSAPAPVRSSAPQHRVWTTATWRRAASGRLNASTRGPRSAVRTSGLRPAGPANPQNHRHPRPARGWPWL